jgi:hypothetical protein
MRTGTALLCMCPFRALLQLACCLLTRAFVGGYLIRMRPCRRYRGPTSLGTISRAIERGDTVALRDPHGALVAWTIHNEDGSFGLLHTLNVRARVRVRVAGCGASLTQPDWLIRAAWTSHVSPRSSIFSRVAPACSSREIRATVAAQRVRGRGLGSAAAAAMTARISARGERPFVFIKVM